MHRLLFLSVLFLPLLSARGADDPNAAFQAKMRDTLRATMQQLNDAQGQLATTQAAQAQAEKDKADLQAKIDAAAAQLKTLSEQSAADKEAAAKSTAALNAQLAAQTKRGADLETALAQWKGAYGQMAALAKKTEEARAKLAGEKTVLERLVDDRELKNAQLYKTGTEILDRYEKFSLGDAISAKEPFVGVTRVKLQTLVQDYQDKLLDQRISPGQPPTTPPPPAAKQTRTATLEKATP